MSKLIIIDGNAIVHRAYHALPPLTTKDGRMVNAVYGFTSMLLRVWHDLHPTHIAVTFDMAGATFRHEQYKEYKATRVKADQELYDQIPLCHNLVAAFNIPIYEKKGYEADDVIGTIAKQVAKDAEVIIVTGDKDSIQLVDKNISVYTLRKGMSDTVTYNPTKVKEVFGFEPHQMIDYKALAGDSSDNIPGIKGIGEKTAVELIQKFGSVDEIYKKIFKNEKAMAAQLKPSVFQKLINDEKSARMSYELATIDTKVPSLDFKLADCTIKDFDREKVVKIFQEFEFTSLLKRIPGYWGPVEEKKSAKNKNGEKIKTDFKFEEVKDKKTMAELVKKITSTKSFAARAILGGPDVFSSPILGMAIVVDEYGYWIPTKFLEDFWPVFENKDIELVGHDLKQLYKVLLVQKKTITNRIFDTMIASYLLNPGSRAHDSASVVLKVLGKELPVGAGQESLFGVDARAVTQELWFIAQTADKLKKELVKTDNLGLLEKIEMPLISVLAQIELSGVAVDLPMLQKLSKEVAEEIKKVTKKIYKESGEEFNISSPQQLREVLFEKMGLPTDGVKKGKTGLSTNAEELEKLRGLHPIIAEIENYRELAKLQNTYIDVLPTLINKTTGRIHANFNQAVTATGRLSSSDPNLQNIPIRTELGRSVRKAFVSEPGNVLISADYSQIELRIVASLAQDKKMMEIFERGEDIHTATAAAIHGVPLNEVTKELRRSAKEINFGILYGMGSYGLSWRAEIPVWQAKEFIEKYFEQFSGVKKYLDETIKLAGETGYCETLFGRRRYLPELNSPNYQIRSGAERMAVNHPVQGTAADLIKMAMVEISQRLGCHPRAMPTGRQENGDLPKRGADSRFRGNDNVRMILQVHDELVFEVKKGLEDEVAKMVKEIMEGVVKLRVPVKVETSIGHSWGEMK